MPDKAICICKPRKPSTRQDAIDILCEICKVPLVVSPESLALKADHPDIIYCCLDCGVTGVQVIKENPNNNVEFRAVPGPDHNEVQQAIDDHIFKEFLQ